MKAPKDIAKDLPLKCKLQYNKNTIVRICKFARRLWIEFVRLFVMFGRWPINCFFSSRRFLKFDNTSRHGDKIWQVLKKARKSEPFIKSLILSINFWEYRKVHSKGTHNVNLLNNNSIKTSYLTYLSLNPSTNAAYCALQTETEKKLFAMKKLLLESLCTEDQVLRKVPNYTYDNMWH